VEYTTDTTPQRVAEEAWAFMTRGTWQHKGSVSKGHYNSGDQWVEFRAPDRPHGCLITVFTAGLVWILPRPAGPSVTLSASVFSDGATHVIVGGSERLVHDLSSWVAEDLEATPLTGEESNAADS
jgi:hypothetical protein